MNERNVPRDLKYAAIQSRLDYMKARDAKNDNLLNRLTQIQEAYTREINEFLGPKSKDYRTFYEKRREAVRSMKPKFTATPEGSKTEIEFAKARSAEADKFIKDLGINGNDLKSIRNKYQEEFRQVIEKATELTNSKQEGL
jgi:small-conductance mechanosensitive channel